MERFHDLLFEVSNENRHGILLLLKKRAMRITELSRQMGLTTTEISRHVNRLGEFGLLQKNPDGSYSITYFGELTLLLLEEFEFASRNIHYFVKHDVTRLPTQYVKRIGELSGSEHVDDAIRFLHLVEDIISDSEKFVWLKVDQYPLTAMNSIVEALNRGVNIRLIEKREIEFGPHIDLGSSRESDLKRTRQSPLVTYKTLEEIDVLLILSEQGCALAFPNQEGKFDYSGFVAEDERSVSWCKDLFEQYWGQAEDRVPITPTEYVARKAEAAQSVSGGIIVVEGRNDPDVDAQAIQDAVDNYDEVILRGTFNLGTSQNEVYCGKGEPIPTCHNAKAAIVLRKSVILRGEGREDDVPSTKLYKRGWIYPVLLGEQDCVFFIDGEGIDVTIENIHVTDFNVTCIIAEQGDSLKILNNRITLDTGIGRGTRFGQYGDVVMGIRSTGHFLGGILIEGNYLDFALINLGVYQYRHGLPDDPEYRPDLTTYGNYRGIGIYLDLCKGKAVVRDNEVRNMNSRGIAVWDNYETARVYVKDNVVESDVYGVYPYFTMYAGVGILAQSSHLQKMLGFYIEIENNRVRCSKVNYCGIGVLGGDQEGLGNLVGGIIRSNEIHLEDGSVGILINAGESFDVSENVLSGEVYYGVQFTGREGMAGIDLRATENIAQGNNMDGLRIKEPNGYSDKHADGKTFAIELGKSQTAHYWFTTHTKGHDVKVKTYETVIDEGDNNTITHVKTRN